MKNYIELEIETIKNKFYRFAEGECKQNSPLYYCLSHEISKDETLCEIAAYTKYGQPIPNSFLASVQYLLIKNTDNLLANYYPTLSNNQVDRIPFDLFKQFVLENREQIISIISEKIVQTNVINRCAFLFPIFFNIIKKENRPTTIIDIGCSIGLNLNFDLYQYEYNGMKTYGDSKVICHSEIKDGNIPTLEKLNVQIKKIGIDQNLINIDDENELDWIRALIWADHTERFNQIDEALSLYIQNKPELIKGKSITDFEKIINLIDNDQNLIIYSTFTLYQFTEEQRLAFYQMLDRIGRVKNFYFISAEGIKNLLEKYEITNTVVELISYKDGVKMEQLVSETNGHGNWIVFREYII